MSSETLHLQASQSDDEVAVRALYTQLMDGWNKGSGEAFAAPFAEDGHLIAFDGTHFKGRDEIVSFHQPLFDKWLKGTRLVGEVESVRFLSPDVALMHALGGTVMRGKSRSAPERDSIQTLVAIKRNGMAPRRISEYKGQAHEPERSEYFHLAVHGLAVESVWSKEIDDPAHLTNR